MILHFYVKPKKYKSNLFIGKTILCSLHKETNNLFALFLALSCNLLLIFSIKCRVVTLIRIIDKENTVGGFGSGCMVSWYYYFMVSVSQVVGVYDVFSYV